MAVGENGECVDEGRCDCAGTDDDVQSSSTDSVIIRERELGSDR